MGVIDAVDLPEDEDMELSVIWVPPETEGEVTRLDVDVVIVTADNSRCALLTLMKRGSVIYTIHF